MFRLSISYGYDSIDLFCWAFVGYLSNQTQISYTKNRKVTYQCSFIIFNGYQSTFRGGGKPPGSVFDHSPPRSAQIKNEWRYTSTPPYMPSLREWGSVTFSHLSGERIFTNYDGFPSSQTLESRNRSTAAPMNLFRYIQTARCDPARFWKRSANPRSWHRVFSCPNYF